MDRNLAVFLFLTALVWAVPVAAEELVDENLDWAAWRRLPVLAGGRYKPLDTLAEDTMRAYCGRTRLKDPESGRRIDAVAAYLAMIFDWQGWDHSPDAEDAGTEAPEIGYFDHHQPDKWDRARWIRVDSPQLREALGLPQRRQYASPQEIIDADFRDPATGRQVPFVMWTQQIAQGKREKFSPLEEKALDLTGTLQQYQHHRTGQGLSVVPIRDSRHQEWLSIASLMQGRLDDQTDPDGSLRELKGRWQRVRKAYLDESPEAFREASAAYLATAEKLGPELAPNEDAYPQPWRIRLEVAYNHGVPFRFAGVLAGAAFVCTLLSLGWQGRRFYGAAWLFSAACLLAMLAGFAVRGLISGWVPVTNMYESMVCAALGALVLGSIFELRYRRRYILSATTVVCGLLLVLADGCPSIIDPSIRPLPPVLRSNYWLATHVVTIVLGYAGLAVALGIGNITLSYYLVGSRNTDVIRNLSKYTYEALKAGVLMLTLGTILGAMWADDSWGRFWSWDSKEVWALVTLLLFLGMLHARYLGWVTNRGLAAWSVVCFAVVVVMATYGVNFVLRQGMHSYGSGGGGQVYVFSAVAVQLLYVMIATGVSALRDLAASRAGSAAASPAVSEASL
ncbi:MAG: cytochrome c biogenesis protein CcsA [Pirellulales bacterium]|nr:cytochrome c biogenesis protein CcsA [Pirellulales bacterium]